MPLVTPVIGTVTLVKIDRFMTVIENMPTDNPVTITQGGQEITGCPIWKGVVFFRDGGGQVFVTFVKKKTKIWQLCRDKEPGFTFDVQSMRQGEFRPADKHSEHARTVVTYVKLQD